MPIELPRKSVEKWPSCQVAAGESREVRLAVSESHSGLTVRTPLLVKRAKEDGPVVFVTAALHGDEINGTGAIRQLLQDEELKLARGAVIFVPVLNLLAFDRHERYLPDRRDLNRCFPGTRSGSLASRMARTIFEEIVARSDYGIDLHTAAAQRTNFPNVRGDLDDPGVHRLGTAFGCELVVNGRGPEGTLRRSACAAGRPTIIMEGGEIWKVEPSIVETAVRGIKNVLASLDMLEATPKRPDYQVLLQSTRWVRADRGGFLDYHVQPGEIVDAKQPLATNTTLLGRENRVIHAPFDAVVIGMSTMPAVSPGEPICHLGRLPDGLKPSSLRRMRSSEGGLGEQVVDDLATNVRVTDPPAPPPIA